MANYNNARIYVAGHQGMVGSAIVRNLQHRGYSNIVVRTSTELDLTNQMMVRRFFEKEKIDQIYLAAAKVGGIHANNTYPAEFIYRNLMIQSNVIHEAWCAGITKLLFLGSSCIYPKNAPQPMTENALLSGKLEPTNEPYAIAKIAGIKLCESYNRQYHTDYRSVMPTNLYGPGDNYHPDNSHVVPALLRRFHEAKLQNRDKVVIWGTGTPCREFLHVDDMADACVHLMTLSKEIYQQHTEAMQSHVNVGTGEEVTIRQLAELIKAVVGYTGAIEYDTTKSNGTMRKLMSNHKLNQMGWTHKINLHDGLRSTYRQYFTRATEEVI